MINLTRSVSLGVLAFVALGVLTTPSFAEGSKSAFASMPRQPISITNEPLQVKPVDLSGLKVDIPKIKQPSPFAGLLDGFQASNWPNERRVGGINGNQRVGAMVVGGALGLPRTGVGNPLMTMGTRGGFNTGSTAGKIFAGANILTGASNPLQAAGMIAGVAAGANPFQRARNPLTGGGFVSGGAISPFQQIAGITGGGANVVRDNQGRVVPLSGRQFDGRTAAGSQQQRTLTEAASPGAAVQAANGIQFTAPVSSSGGGGLFGGGGLLGGLRNFAQNPGGFLQNTATRVGTNFVNGQVRSLDGRITGATGGMVGLSDIGGFAANPSGTFNSVSSSFDNFSGASSGGYSFSPVSSNGGFGMNQWGVPTSSGATPTLGLAPVDISLGTSAFGTGSFGSGY